MTSPALTKEDLLLALNDLKIGLKAELKAEIKGEIKTEIKALEARMEIKMEDHDRKIFDFIRMENSKILTRFDSWAKELETAHQDREMSTAKLADHTQTLKDHDQRIKKLEKLAN